ncbi:MAG: hypothetical protein H7282_05100 [Cytophagaceae bacterium]|nr:hypothetical protein [Cytophagaceae bacterium]
MLDIKKFTFPELFNDSNGKTDPALVAGFLGCLIAMGGIILAGSIGLLVANSEMKTTESAPILDFCKNLVSECNQLFIFAAGILVAHRLSKDKSVTQ